MLAEKGCLIRGQSVWGKLGVAVNKSNKLEPFLSLGEVFDDNIGTIVPSDEDLVLPILAFCESPAYHESLRLIDQKVNVTAATLVKVPFDIGQWRQIANEKYRDEVLRPESDDPAQWLFSGHPIGSEYPLQVAIARLLGYHWPRQTGSSFPCSAAVGPDDLEDHADSDGIVCLSSIAGEPPAADRLRVLLADAYGLEWSAAKLSELVPNGESLETWLRDKFFEDHCILFHNRPFIWHVWDGRNDGFHAFLNYHRLAGPDGEGRHTLEKLIYTSLGDWITRQQAEVDGGVDGAEGRLAAAKHLKSELMNILNGESPYDLFIRWKPLHEQPIGWEPDLNDGVRLNIRPWLNSKPYKEPNQKLRQGACVLRVTPIKLPLGKDRGKEPLRDKEDFPWYATNHDRTNDEHFTLEKKRAARERNKKA